MVVEPYFLAVVYLMAAYGFFQMVMCFLGRFCRQADRGTSKPFLSIVVALRNKESMVEGFLRCLLNFRAFASRVDYEVVAVDDESSDGTPDIIERLARRFQSLRPVRMSEARAAGASSALEVGSFVSRGPVIIVCDARGQFDLRRVLAVLLCLLDGAHAGNHSAIIRQMLETKCTLL